MALYIGFFKIAVSIERVATNSNSLPKNGALYIKDYFRINFENKCIGIYLSLPRSKTDVMRLHIGQCALTSGTLS